MLQYCIKIVIKQIANKQQHTAKKRGEKNEKREINGNN